MILILSLICFVPSTLGLTEVILTRNQFNDFVSEMQKISTDINIEDGTITADLSKLEKLVEQQNSKFDTLIAQNSQLLQASQNSFNSLNDLNRAVDYQTVQQSDFRSDWYKEFENIMTPINQILSDVNAAINIVKETTNAINTIFEAFQGTQDASVEAIQTSVESIAAEFELGMRKVVAEALAGASITLPALECIAFEGDACEYDPLGLGPIICEGAEAESCQAEGIVIEPIL